MKPSLAFVLGAGLALLGAAASSPAAGAGLPPLTSPATQQQVPGRFVWGDLFSTDPQASAQFYSGVLGWTSETLTKGEKGYVLLRAGGQPVAGIVRGPAHPAKRESARWVGYISTDDVNKSATAITAKGGRIIAGPRDVPDRGVHAIAIDPQGGLFGLLDATGGDPGDFLAEVNEWAWIALFARDTKAGAEFYRDTVGYTVADESRTERTDDFILATGDTARAGVTPMPEGSPYGSLWVGFVRVADIKATLAAATTHGGKILVEPKVTSNDLAIALVEDPFGGIFGLVTLNLAPSP